MNSENDSKSSKRKLNFEYIEKGVDTIIKSKNTYIMLMLILGFMLKFQSANFYTTSFLLANPLIDCYYPTNVNDTAIYKVKCSLGDVCDWNNAHPDPNDQVQYQYQNSTRGDYSIITTYHLDCHQSITGFYASTLALGNTVFVALFPISRNFIGDAKTLKITCFIGIFFYIMVLVFPYLWVQFVAGFFTLGTSPIFTNNFQTYFNDIVPKEKRGSYTMYMNALFPISGLIYTLVFMFFPNWISIRVVTVVMLGLTTIYMLLLLKNSPIHYFNHKNYKEVFSSFQEISKINGTEKEYREWDSKILRIEEDGEIQYYIKADEPEIDDEILAKGQLSINNDPINNDEENKEKNTEDKEKEKLLKDQQVSNKPAGYVNPPDYGFLNTMKILYKYDSEWWGFMLMNFIFLISGFARCYVAIQLSYVTDIILVSIIFFIIEATFYIITALVSDLNKFGRKMSLFVLFGVGIVFLTITYIMTYVKYKYYRGLVTLLFVRISQDTMSRYVMLVGSEYYSLDTLSYSYGINLFMQRAIGVIASYMVVAISQTSVIVLAVLNVLGFISTFFIQETTGRKIYNTVEEKQLDQNKKEN